jgi:hypothetical protein
MRQTKTRRASPYSHTDESETLAIDTFKNLVDHKKVKLDLKERDKYPNIDGYAELVDEFLVPIAKLEVQIRKLPSEEPKMQCPISLFSYSEIACYPVLFIGVDIKQKKAYWIHMRKDLIAESKIERNQKTITITFPVKNIVDGRDTIYVEKWKSIAQINQMKIREFNELKDSFELLSEKANPALGIDRKGFQDIHVFLDEINTLLDGKFPIVKKIFYPSTWKVGLAYSKYEDNNISYTLYPIPLNKNDVQIKEVDDHLRQQLENEGLGWTGHYVENPIKLRPKKYAIEIVESDTLRILESKLLNHRGNEFLAKEYIFAFIDKFFRQLGLDKKDKYALDEIEEAFFQYLPTWVHETMKFMIKVQRNNVKSYADLLYRKPYFDPDMLLHQIMNNERKQIEQRVKKRIRQKDIPTIVIGNDKFPFGIFDEFLSFLRSKGFVEINRVYSPRDYSRLKEKGGWVWNFFSPDAVETNLKIFFDNLPKVYYDVVLQNFPKIAREIPLFGDASRVIISFSVKEECKTFTDRPKIEFFCLKTEKQDSLEIEIYRNGENEELRGLSWDCLGKDIEIKGKKHRLVSGSRGTLDFIYDDLPMFSFLYKILEKNLKRYFDSLRKREKT